MFLVIGGCHFANDLELDRGGAWLGSHVVSSTPGVSGCLIKDIRIRSSEAAA